jgi:transposase InsO family protein
LGNKGRWELLRAIYERYRKAGRKEKKVILSEFCANAGYNRKYAIRLLNGPRPGPWGSEPRRGRGVSYSQEVVALLTAVWEAAGYPWSVRLKALLPLWMPWIRKHYRVRPEMEQQLLRMSARQMDRRLKNQKTQRRRRIYGRTKPGYLLKHHIPVKTDRWDVTTPGFTEVDLVSHSGNSAFGEFAHTLNVTDIHSTWTESRAVLGRGEEAVQRALNEIAGVLPFALLGVDSDNGSEFINWHLKSWCERKQIQLTRGRPYKKDDNAHIEQKNWTHVRKLLGWDRYDTHEAVEAINNLYRNELRLWLNLYLPSVKLLKKVRVGSKVRRVYDGPRTPFERVKACPQADRERVARLEELRKSLDPFQLGKIIERKLLRISKLANRRQSPRAQQQEEAKTSQRSTGRTGCGKDARKKRGLGNPANPAVFPLSHSHNNNKLSVTFQMSRQQLLGLHS